MTTKIFTIGTWDSHGRYPILIDGDPVIYVTHESRSQAYDIATRLIELIEDDEALQELLE